MFYILRCKVATRHDLVITHKSELLKSNQEVRIQLVESVSKFLNMQWTVLLCLLVTYFSYVVKSFLCHYGTGYRKVSLKTLAPELEAVWLTTKVVDEEKLDGIIYFHCESPMNSFYKWALENVVARDGLRELTCKRLQIYDLFFDSPIMSATIHWEKDGSDSLCGAEQMSALVCRRALEELDCMQRYKFYEQQKLDLQADIPSMEKSKKSFC
ncbi:hypothetical protein Anapl_14036 [Anas platyrhynchos]|uniref:Uncharacterized protein n=1 Tax=Anas platyrhynchos TaxID=8839 RepID=R0K557_ANAPL|nr:hypothetical protein Anapl_14036 [Anas platyrhynchos]